MQKNLWWGLTKGKKKDLINSYLETFCDVFKTGVPTNAPGSSESGREHTAGGGPSSLGLQRK